MRNIRHKKVTKVLQVISKLGRKRVRYNPGNQAWRKLQGVLWEPEARVPNPVKKFFVEGEIPELNLEQGFPE